MPRAYRFFCFFVTSWQRHAPGSDVKVTNGQISPTYPSRVSSVEEEENLTEISGLLVFAELASELLALADASPSLAPVFHHGSLRHGK
ncbi:hypothetical protein BDBG_04725 [Blastomyces gilchristii SLH14081]|uniref:Uncharacterized protein n=1 Tax=Blastomyces gilchristii (strain SLH14081) TaxID=559298 RepID=A0A179UPQ4_BLAGS|nr:uncharacterized protein BDBG_04725 [Blastomyces gilchristii SLH14081]EQL30820.1 hypothetical protein BDFG_06703 [Blastomyces dermatitidis ATCC 26199]OAT09178.1 hypothetical protein BDBG_04725 [Blastomyces gilchristii SLH14081]